MNEFRGEAMFERIRSQMVERDLKGRGIADQRVLAVMGEIGREDFVPESYRRSAYSDGPLPISCGQTISQPYIVALMTEQLRVCSDGEVLEIGTGSGYQTAILSRLAKKVYTMEKFAELSASARAVLERLGITNVEYRVGDGSCGWPEDRTFDRIMITAAVPAVPEPLTGQLREGGIIIAPVGPPMVQQLIAFEKKRGQMKEEMLCDVRFVKLVGRYGFEQ